MTQSPFVLKGVAGVQEIAKLTGPGAMNDTLSYAVAGTDLGHSINVGDKTYFIFGDTFGVRDPESYGGNGEDFRSCVLAATTDDDPSDGITFDRFIVDRPGHARELITAQRISGIEISTIPSAGFAVGDTLYLHYVSIRQWGEYAPDGPTGVWWINYSALRKSTDGGETFHEVPGVRWPGESYFVQAAARRAENAANGEIYFWTTPAGRYGGLKLMKVPDTEVENQDSYRYFGGMAADGNPIWSPNMDDAELMVDDTLGEMSVIWNPWLDRWLLAYLRGAGDIVLREAVNPWGPWSEPVVLLPQSGFADMYGPYMNPRYMENDGETIYFCLSRWAPYNVFWMKAKLVK